MFRKIPFLSVFAGLFVLISYLILPGSSFSETADFKGLIESKANEFQRSGKLIVDGHELYAPHLVRGAYQLNDYQPLWNRDNRKAYIDAVETLFKDGLNPQDYVFPEVAGYLEMERQGPLDTTQLLNLDLLLSEGLVRALYNLAFGKVDPVALDPNINFSRPLTKKDLAPFLVDHVQRGDFKALFNEIRPAQQSYVDLKTGLERYRALQAEGGWETIPPGETLRLGDASPRVVSLRNRLLVTGDLPAESTPKDPSVFDEALETAVKTFQHHQGLKEDGAVGPGTLTALNVPVEDRIAQIRINLERQRWYSHELEGEFIGVDIAGFTVYWIKDGKVIWEEMVQVGKEFTSTPVFSDQIEYLEFNPTWTIPPGIIERSILPSLRKDPGYLQKKGFILLDLDGKPVDPRSVNWSTLKGFPYLVRQPAGPDNALGQVKFMFPNPHYVFLHDTDHRDLFDRTRRTFSSGCIRVRHPFDLAERLLAGQDGWTRERIDQVVASGKTTRVNLDRPMRIIIGYRTAYARDGEMFFQEDIYHRDPAVLDALDGTFQLRRQDLKKQTDK